MCNHFYYRFSLLIAITNAYTISINSDDIEGGEPTDIEQRSYIVSVEGTGGERICGGALIDEITAVTAASCLTYFDQSDLVVNVNNGDKIVQVSKFKCNPSFDAVTMENNVAILKLAEAVKAEYITLASAQPPPGASGVVSGWNAKKELVDICKTFISTEDCVSEEYGYSQAEVLESMVCGMGEGCGGLEGNPFVVSEELVGLVSWGYACANKEKPAVFSDIASLKDWIETTSQSL